jgi:serine/threonine-protein kinase 24/25/MST4
VILTWYSFSTVRPVKNVDKIKTARLSAGYIGTGSVRRLLIPAEAATPRSKPTTDRGKAGEVLVDEVILGVLDSVSDPQCYPYYQADLPLMTQTSAGDHDAQTLEALNMIRKGFADLGAVNPDVAYKVVMGVLGGIKK